MERREFFTVAGLAAVRLPIRDWRVPRPSPVPRPPSQVSQSPDPVIEALVALAQARRPGVLSEADVMELRRQVGFVVQAVDALRAVKLTNADGPSCVAAA